MLAGKTPEVPAFSLTYAIYMYVPTYVYRRVCRGVTAWFEDPLQYVFCLIPSSTLLQQSFPALKIVPNDVAELRLIQGNKLPQEFLSHHRTSGSLYVAGTPARRLSTEVNEPRLLSLPLVLRVALFHRADQVCITRPANVIVYMMRWFVRTSRRFLPGSYVKSGGLLGNRRSSQRTVV